MGPIYFLCHWLGPKPAHQKQVNCMPTYNKTKTCQNNLGHADLQLGWSESSDHDQPSTATDLITYMVDPTDSGWEVFNISCLVIPMHYPYTSNIHIGNLSNFLWNIIFGPFDCVPYHREKLQWNWVSNLSLEFNN